MNIEKKKILVVEDEFITASDLISNLEQIGFILPASTDTGEEVYDLACRHKPDIILMDINLKGDMSGIVAADIVKRKLDIPVVFLTGQSDEATIEKAIEAEPFGYIIKPFEERDLKTVIAMALYKHAIDHQLAVSEDRYRQISESSDNLIAIFNPEGTFEYLNQPGGRILHLNPSDLLGKHISDTLNTPMLAEMQRHLQSFSSGSKKWTERIKIITQDREVWLYSTMIPLMENLSGEGQILWTAKDITEWIELQQKMQKRGLMQLEKNMEHFQILNDQIRNPLTLISLYATNDEGPSCDKILEAVQMIDDLVTKLDKGWIESEKVRSFLIRHYQHGVDL